MSIAEGLSNYLSDYSRLPDQSESSSNPASRSWRVDILLNNASAGEELADYRTSEPWNSEHNLGWASRWGAKNYYHCPRDSGPKVHTSYLSVEGENTWYATAVSGKVDWDPGKALKNFKQLKPDPKEIGNTIVVLEVHQSGIHWMEPKDFSISDLPTTYDTSAPNVLISGHSSSNGYLSKMTYALFSDGSVRSLSASTDRKILRSLIEVDHPEKPTQRFE